MMAFLKMVYPVFWAVLSPVSGTRQIPNLAHIFIGAAPVTRLLGW
jgi:hypothetical protein